MLCFKRESEKPNQPKTPVVNQVSLANDDQSIALEPIVNQISLDRDIEPAPEPHEETKTILGTAVATIANANPWNYQIRALCDSGSQIGLITRNAIKRLGLTLQQSQTGLLGGGNTNIGTTLGKVVVEIKLINNESFYTTLYVVNRIVTNLPLTKTDMNKYEEFKDLHRADPRFGIPAPIDALFGVRIWLKILEPGVIKTPDELAADQRTKLGWIIYQVAPDNIPKN